METVVFIYLVIGVISLVLTYFLISFATKSRERNWHDQVQTKLLTQIAKKQGVNDEEINECFKVKF